MPPPPSGERAKEAEPGMRSVIYGSPPSRLVRTLSVVFTAKVTGALGLAGWWTWEEWGKLQRILEAAEASGRELAAFMETTDLPLPWFSPGAALALLAYMGLWQVHRGTRRVVVKLTREVDAEGRELVRIEGMGALWGTYEVVKRRDQVECSAPNRLITHFITLPEGAWFLLPVPGWYSEDLAYLKTLLWWRYFRDSPPKVPEANRIAIEGFGPFRPAALADPYHPAHKAMPFPATEKDLVGTKLFAAADGNVYAHFPADHRASLEERRADALEPLLLASELRQRRHTTTTTTPPRNAASAASSSDSLSLAQSGTVTRSETPDGVVRVSIRVP